MIHIKDNYYITADANCYSLAERRISGPDAKEPGKEYFAPLSSYHTTMSAALSAYVKRVQRKAVESQDYTLAEAIAEFKAIEAAVRNILGGVIKEATP